MLIGQGRIYKVDKHVDNILRYDAKLKDIVKLMLCEGF